jgi:UDP-N-acetylglucosamine acyltransferase
VEPSAEIGADVRIGPFCVIDAGVEIGDRCVLESQVTVSRGTTLGPDNVISPMAVLGGPPQVVTYRGEPTRLVVGARNHIREFSTLHRGSPKGDGVTTIGDDNYLMAHTHIAHDCKVGDGTTFANAATLAGHVEVADGAFVGAFCGVHQFCRVAREAFIGGYSVVTRDALPWVLTVGNRARSHGVNLVGMKRKGYRREVIEAVKRCYMTLFRSKMRLEEALTKVEAELGEFDEVRYFVEFVRSSERGISR